MQFLSTRWIGKSCNIHTRYNKLQTVGRKCKIPTISAYMSYLPVIPKLGDIILPCPVFLSGCLYTHLAMCCRTQYSVTNIINSSMFDSLKANISEYVGCLPSFIWLANTRRLPPKVQHSELGAAEHVRDHVDINCFLVPLPLSTLPPPSLSLIDMTEGSALPRSDVKKPFIIQNTDMTFCNQELYTLSSLQILSAAISSCHIVS